VAIATTAVRCTALQSDALAQIAAAYQRQDEVERGTATNVSLEIQRDALESVHEILAEIREPDADAFVHVLDFV